MRRGRVVGLVYETAPAPAVRARQARMLALHRALVACGLTAAQVRQVQRLVTGLASSRRRVEKVSTRTGDVRVLGAAGSAEAAATATTAVMGTHQHRGSTGGRQCRARVRR